MLTLHSLFVTVGFFGKMNPFKTLIKRPRGIYIYIYMHVATTYIHVCLWMNQASVSVDQIFTQLQVQAIQGPPFSSTLTDSCYKKFA